jgi:hypothetical protein
VDSVTKAFNDDLINQHDLALTEDEYEELADFTSDILSDQLQDPNAEDGTLITDPKIIESVVQRIAAYSFMAGRAYQAETGDEITVSLKPGQAQALIQQLLES